MNVRLTETTSLRFGIHLVRRSRITPEQLVDAVEHQLACQVQIGHLAISRGLLTFGQVKEVLLRQAESQLPFGSVAVRLGYLTDKDIANLLLEQANSEPPLCSVLAVQSVLSAAAGQPLSEPLSPREH